METKNSEIEPWLAEYLNQEIKTFQDGLESSFKVFQPIGNSDDILCKLCEAIKEIKLPKIKQDSWITHINGRLHKSRWTFFSESQKCSNLDIEPWLAEYLDQKMETFQDGVEASFKVFQPINNSDGVVCKICEPIKAIALPKTKQDSWIKHINGSLHKSQSISFSKRQKTNHPEIEPWLEEYLKLELKTFQDGVESSFKVFQPIAYSDGILCKICEAIKEIKLPKTKQDRWINHVNGKLHKSRWNFFSQSQKCSYLEIEPWLEEYLEQEIEIFQDGFESSFKVFQPIANSDGVLCKLCEPIKAITLPKIKREVWINHINGILHSTQLEKLNQSMNDATLKSRKEKEEELDKVLKKRQSRIDYCKNTLVYGHYIAQVPKAGRSDYLPKTPDKYRTNLTSEQFDVCIDAWKVELHDWYQSEIRSNEENSPKKSPSKLGWADKNIDDFRDNY